MVATDLTVRLLGKSVARKTISLAYPLAIISSIIVVYLEGNILSHPMILTLVVLFSQCWATGVLDGNITQDAFESSALQ